MKLTCDAQKAVDVIIALGGRPLLVGGFVRDWLIGLPSKDIDIEVHGPVTPEALHLALDKVGRVDAVGMSFGVLKFGRDVDISFPRRDSKSGDGHTGFAIEFDQDMTVEEALARRDFTINSIAVDPITHEVIDPFGGQADIKLGVIRATAPEAFSDDPLRVLRAVQFAGRFGFRIEPETARLCRAVSNSFGELSIERVWGEWEKILTKGKSLSAVVLALHDTHWIKHFPELPDHTMSIFADLTILRVDDLWVTGERRAAILLASLFSGRTMALKAFLRRIDAPQWLRHASVKLAEPVPTKEPVGDRVKLRIIARLLGQKVQLQDWLLVHWQLPGSLSWAMAAQQGILEAAHPRLLRGEHLLARGFEAGPIFAVILTQAEVEQDRKGWLTEDEAIEWLDQNWTA